MHETIRGVRRDVLITVIGGSADLQSVGLAWRRR